MKKLVTRGGQPVSLNPSVHQPADTNTPGPSCTNILPQQTASPQFPEGIEVIHDEPDATVDICFVHGLAGNRTTAWAVKDQPGFWSKTFLASKLEKIRILTFGYNVNSESDSVASPNTFVDHALLLLAELTNNRHASGASSHPLIFVARGLGGLICKGAMILSHASRNDLTRGVYQCLERIIHLGAPSETEVEISLMKAFLQTPQLIDHGIIDNVQPLFNSLLSTRNGEDKDTYMPLDFEMKSTQVSHLVNSTDSARLDMRNSSPSHGNRIDTTTLSEARGLAIEGFIADLRVLIAGISSRRHETTRHNASKTEALTSTGAGALRSSSNGGAPRFRRPAPITTRPYAILHFRRRINYIQTINAASTPSPLPTNHPPTGVYSIRTCYIICFVMFLIVVGSASLGIYYTVRFDKMGDGFTAASWIVAIGALSLAGPLARHYPHCSCWVRGYLIRMSCGGSTLCQICEDLVRRLSWGSKAQ